MLDLPLKEDASVIRRMEALYRSWKRSMPDHARIQAMVPAGARVLPNAAGTAPGLAITLNPNPYRAGQESLLVLLPGPPRELYPMFNESVTPLLSEVFQANEPFVCHTLRSTGVPESTVQHRIQEPLSRLVEQGLSVGYCARPGEVDVRLSARGSNSEQLVSQARGIVNEQLSGTVYSEADEEFEFSIVRLLIEKKRTLAVAESCSGGLISHLITNVPGASAVFLGGFVTYSNAAKQHSLGVNAALIETHGAVSEEVCRSMAEGVSKESGSTIGLAVTGIAGPGGGSTEKPVGTVFIGIADQRGTTVVRRMNPWDRATFKQVTAQQALDMVRRRVLELPVE